MGGEFLGVSGGVGGDEFGEAPFRGGTGQPVQGDEVVRRDGVAGETAGAAGGEAALGGQAVERGWHTRLMRVRGIFAELNALCFAPDLRAQMIVEGRQVAVRV